ncbi:MAG: RNA methyltransferase [Bacteroidia bacterium]|nr:RNA methyltransferase [Bacteroidia bacterium]
MEKIKVTDIRALRRAIEGGSCVEKVVWRKGAPPPPSLWELIKKHRIPFQQVPSSELQPGHTWCAYLSPLSLYTAAHLLEASPSGVALALIGVTDPRNVGAICRNAAAFGVEWILLRAEGSPLLSNDALWRASAGTLPLLKIIRELRPISALKALQKKGWTLAATVSPRREAIPYWAWDWLQPSILLIGAEGEGLPSDYERICQVHLTIPHKREVESLNVSSATALFLAEYYRRVFNR